MHFFSYFCSLCLIFVFLNHFLQIFLCFFENILIFGKKFQEVLEFWKQCIKWDNGKIRIFQKNIHPCPWLSSIVHDCHFWKIANISHVWLVWINLKYLVWYPQTYSLIPKLLFYIPENAGISCYNEWKQKKCENFPPLFDI